jgi:hypothetical protein
VAAVDRMGRGYGGLIPHSHWPGKIVGPDSAKPGSLSSTICLPVFAPGSWLRSHGPVRVSPADFTGRMAC